jgi:flagellar hook-length control protein FliK
MPGAWILAGAVSLPAPSVGSGSDSGLETDTVQSAASLPATTGDAMTGNTVATAPETTMLAGDAAATSTIEQAPPAGALPVDDHGRTDSSAPTTDLSALASLARGLPTGAAANAVGSDVTAGRSIGVAVSDPRWPSAVAAQVQLMVSANTQNVTLRLSPEHLGPLEVHIDVQATQINVSFVAVHPETRSALEQTVPTLRALLAQGGLTLGQAQVQGEAGSGSQSAAARTHRPSDEAAAQPPEAVRVMQSVGLIDEYA